MTKLLLIRHGESAHNHGKIFAGQIDSPLGNGLKDVSRFLMPNTAISELIFENEKIYFEKIGISDHLNATEKPLNIV